MTTRKALENYVVAMNSPLRNVVKDMSLIILLRNCVPSLRGDFAFQLFKEGSITKEIVKEFTKVA
jgi:hypothetical protein